MSEMSYLEKLLDGVEVEWLPLGEVSVLRRGRVMSKGYLTENFGPYPVYSSQTANNGKIGSINTFDFDGEYISWTTDGANAGTVFYRTGKFSITNVCGLITLKSKYPLIYKFLFYWLTIEAKKHVYSGMGNPKLMSHQVENIPVPIPCPDNPEKSLAIQSEIVRILDKFTELTAELTAELTMRKKQYNYYRDQLLSFKEGEVEWKTLGTFADNFDSLRKPITSGLRETGNIPYYGASGIVDYVKDYIFDDDLLLISEDGANLIARNTPIAFSISGKTWVNNHAHVLKFKNHTEQKFVEYYLNNINLTPYISGAAQPKLNKKNLESIRIPNPSLKEKEQIVTILDKFDALTNSITEGLPREIELRQKQYEYYRDLLFSFPKPETVSN
ncbi:TPA: restriction endonuclease subunit S [Escherichia coli]|uniref:restriction endonuclease subunit S n=1 Tax=Escherichia coli TaxID=562 RepID=UPI00158B3AF9|nr:restriction endonuclease subunit S [Escherichia coli]EFE1042468.1 restriction endonuclease subunit S [Escherichia coli]ELJ0240253.1 restriction endonuclease subunit S [Escherichia coli]ELO4989586.1 restriction endonuclease subunit S [Escherichia coli]HBN7246918.1 restriction endonuclease subunit S [Escherichia coli]HDN2940781.1 restriction endonuclease subunit S [Escherichia coli]